MSDTQQRPPGRGRQSYPDATGHTEPTRWAGFVVFAGIMLGILGGFQIIQGLVALFNDEYYLVTRNGLVVTLDFTTWGWIHIIVGLVAAAAGLGVLLGKTWARVLGIIIAVISALVNIAFLSAYPAWSSIMIALDVLAIYALAVHGREVTY